MTNDERRPSTALAALAAILPTLFASVSCACFGLASAGRGGAEGVGLAIQEMGSGFWAVLFATALAWLATTVLLFLAGRGMRVPAAATILAAALPWIAGVVAVRSAMATVEEALVNADPSVRATLLAAGIAEAVHSRLLGATLGSGMLAASGFGLALAALAQRAPSRSIALAGAGVLAALPLLGVAGYGAFGASLGLSMGSALVVLAGCGAPIVLALAAAAIGKDERSGALASSAAIGIGAAVLAAGVAASASAMIEIFGALAGAAPGAKAALVGAAAEELAPLSFATKLALPITLVSAAVIAGLAALRARPSIARVAGGAALAIVPIFALGLDAWTMGGAASLMADAGRAEWQEVADVEAVSLPDVGYADVADAIATPAGLLGDDGAQLAAWDRAALARALAPLGARRYEHVVEREETVEAALASEPSVVLALDRRLTGRHLRALIEAASDEGLSSIALAGDLDDRPTPEQEDAVRESLPMLSLLLGGQGSVRVVLESGMPEGSAAEDPILHHVTVSDAVPASTSVRPAVAVSEEDRALRDDAYEYREPTRPLRIAFTDEASVQTIVDTAVRATRSGFRPVLVPGAIPGNPDDPLVPADLVTALGLGTSESATESAMGWGGGVTPTEGVSLRFGATEVRGALSREIVQRMLRRHVAPIRYCYEQGLRRRPELAGTVTIAFVIGPAGSVMSASVSTTTLSDATVESCMVRAVRAITFPAPEAGVVGVSVPYQLASR